MDIQTHNYYQENAAETVARYRAADAGMAPLFRRAFAGCADILDVGCGSGRDLCGLRKLGFDVEGVDASPAMIQAAIAADPSMSGRLRADTLPELSTCADDSYDGVVCSAVLQHLPEDRLFDAAFAFRRILKEHGRLLISIPLPDLTINSKTHRDKNGRLFTPIPPEKLQLLLERTGFVFLWREDSADAMGRDHRRWCTMLFERADGTSRPLHTVESILNRDSKDATYKLALIRALAEIAQTQYAQAIWTPDGNVKIPTELIAGKWLEYYWPLFSSPDFIPQKYGEKPDAAKRIAFRSQLSGLILESRQAGLGDLAGFTVSERSGGLSKPVQKAFNTAIGKLKGTIWNMPVRYAGHGEFSIFQYDRSDQTVVMDTGLWREFSLTGSWIADACILRWSELTSQISKGELQPSQIVDLLLKAPLPERDTSAVRAALGGNASLRCVWTDLELKKFDIDHAIPYALWRNNDLWNLFPAAPAANNQKRDKLPTHRLVTRRKECIVHYWGMMNSAYPVRFIAEASSFCGLRKLDKANWQNPLFHALQEAIETTAVQRGVPRWEPAGLATAKTVVAAKRMGNRAPEFGKGSPQTDQTSQIPVIRIVSGGQTGADRAGLDAGRELGIDIGGWCPKGRRAEDGTIPLCYPLREMPSKEYIKRTEQNVIDSDVTLVFTRGEPTRGSRRTVEFAKKHQRPWIHLDLNADDTDLADELAAWILGLPRELTLNVAGSRASKDPGIEPRVKNILVTVLRQVNELPAPESPAILSADEARPLAFESALPLVGDLAAGIGADTFKTLTLQTEEWVRIPQKLCAPNRFVIRVAGDSMQPDYHVGDLVVCEYHRTPRRPGQTVIAIMARDEGLTEVALKRFEETPTHWVFHSTNPAYEPVQVDRVFTPSHPILGIAIENLGPLDG
ncbi:MAG: putative molybdenum carrier protein [Lentisphaeria bacterium]|nr:putative molybdenum carrier protein [Lentisphaeria bacterium]